MEEEDEDELVFFSRDDRQSTMYLHFDFEKEAVVPIRGLIAQQGTTFSKHSTRLIEVAKITNPHILTFRVNPAGSVGPG